MTPISAQPTKKIQLDNQISLSYSDRSRGGRGGSGQKIEGISVDPNTQSSLLPGSDYIKDNLLEALNNNIEKNLSYSLRYNLVLDYEIIHNMHLKVSGGLDYNQQNQNNFRPSTADTDFHRSYTKGSIGRSLSILNENLLSYQFKIKEHHYFDILLSLSLPQFSLTSPLLLPHCPLA